MNRHNVYESVYISYTLISRIYKKSKEHLTIKYSRKLQGSVSRENEKLFYAKTFFLFF